MRAVYGLAGDSIMFSKTKAQAKPKSFSEVCVLEKFMYMEGRRKP